MIYLFDQYEKLIRVVNEPSIRSLSQREQLTDEHYVSDTLTAEIENFTEKEFDEVEYVAVPSREDKYKYQLYFVLNYSRENNVLTFDGVASGAEELKKTPVYNLRPRNRPLTYVAGQLLEETNWTLGYTADVGTRSAHFYYTNTFEALKLAAQTWGVEFQFFVEINNNRIGDRFIEFHTRVGGNYGARVTHGHNALQLLSETSKSELYTALIGRGKGEEVSGSHENESGQAGYGRKINFADVEWRFEDGDPVDKPLGQEYVELPQATEAYGIKTPDGMKPKIGFVEFSEQEDKEQLLRDTYAQLLTTSRPQRMYKASANYVNIRNIGDTIRVEEPDKRIDYETRVFDITWDRLTGTAVDIKLGDYLVNSNRKQRERVQNAARETISNEIAPVAEAVTYAVTSANGKNTNYHGNVEPDNPRVGDLWFRPHPDFASETLGYIWNGEIWEEWANTHDQNENKRAIEALQQETKAAKQAAESSYTNAVAEAERMTGELSAQFQADLNTQSQALSQDITQGYTNALTDANDYTDARERAVLSDIDARDTALRTEIATAQTTAINQAQTDIQTMEQAFSGQLATLSDEVDDARTTADNAASAIGTAVTNAGFATLDETLASISNSAESALNGLTGKVNVNDYEQQMTSVNSLLSGAKSTADDALNAANELATQVSGFERDVDGFRQTVNNYEDQVAGFRSDVNGLNSTVAAYETQVDAYGNAVATYATEVSTLNNTVSGFDSTVASFRTELDGLEIGGRNLIEGTTSEWEEIHIDRWGYITGTVPLKKLDGRDVVTYSVDIRLNDSGSPVYLRLELVSDSSYKSIGVGELIRTEGRYSLTVKLGDVSGYHSIRARIMPENSSTNWGYSAYRRRSQLEAGSKATGYTKAPEDMATATQVSSLSNTVDGLLSTVSSYEQTVSGYTTQVSEFQNTVDGLNNTVAQYSEDVSGYSAQLSTLNNTVNGFRNTVAAYESQLDDYTSTVNGYSAQVSGFENTLSGFQSTVAKYQVEVDEYGNEVSRYATQVSTFQNTVSGLQSTVADKASQSEVTQLSKGLESIVTDFSNLEIGGRNLLLGTSNEWAKGVLGSWNLIPYGNIYVTPGETLTASVHYRNGSNDFTLRIFEYNSDNIRTESPNGSLVYAGTEGKAVIVRELRPDTVRIQFVIRVNTKDGGTVEYKEAKLERGNRATDWTPAPEDMATESRVTQLADNINARIVEKGQVVAQFNMDNGTTLIQNNKLLLDANTYIMGTTFVNDIKAQSLEVVSANIGSLRTSILTSNVITADMLQTSTATIDKLFATTASIDRLTGKAAFIEDVKAYSLQAVYADIANLRTNVLTANVITATHLNVDGAMIDKLMTNNLLANKLVANSVMTGSMQTNALNAITANITTVRSQVLQANVVESTHIKSDTALIDKLFATTANVDRLTGKAAFIDDIKAIDISADRITTGTLNASNVNIINLNVNDLAGNRSEFVRSAWNTALGESTYIDGNEIRSIGAGGEEISIGSGALNFYNSAGQHLVWMEPTYSDKYAGEVGFGINLRHNRQFSIIRRKTTVPDEVIMQINPLDEHVTFLNDVTVGRLRIKGTNQWLLSRPEGGASLIDSHAVRLGIGRDTGWTDVFTINENHNVDSFGRLRMNDNNIADVSDLEVNSHVYIRKSRGSSYYARMQYRDSNEFHLFANGGLLFGEIYAGQWERILQLLHGGVNMYRRLNMQGNSITNQSDRRLKQNIHDTTISALECIRGTRFVDYEWIDSKRPQGTHLGVIAQETPWLVAYDPDAEFLSIDSSKQTMYNSLAIQELDSNVIQLSCRVEEVDAYTQQALSETQQLKEKVEELEKELNKLKGAV